MELLKVVSQILKLYFFILLILLKIKIAPMSPGSILHRSYSVCFFLIHYFFFWWQIGLKCIVLNSKDVSEFDIDEGGLFLNDVYLQGADWNFQHDRLAESKYVTVSVFIFLSLYLFLFHFLSLCLSLSFLRFFTLTHTVTLVIFFSMMLSYNHDIRYHLE